MATPSPHVHQFFGGTICASCGDSAQPEVLQDPEAFRQGEAMAYRRVLSLLEGIPHDVATKGRDQGRGAAFAVREMTEAIRSLAEDSGVLPLL